MTAVHHREADRPQDFGHIQALDGIRGFAVSAVFFSHAIAYITATATPHPLFENVRTLCLAGWFGVDVFFVLSGFLITTILLDARPATNYFRVFYARRFLRIAPLYYVVMALALLGNKAVPATTQIWFWLNLSNLPTAFHPLLIPFLAHFWSLAIEEQFYLIWPSIVKHSRIWTLAWICIGVIVGVFLARNLPSVLLVNIRFPEFVYRLTPFRIDTLCAGALLAVAVKKRPQWLEHRGLLRIATIVGFGLFAFTGGNYKDPAVIRYGYSGLMLGACGLVGLCLFRDEPIARLFSFPFLRKVGAYSYAFYLFHPFVVNYVGGSVTKVPRVHDRVLHAGMSANTCLLLLLPVEYLLVFGLSALSWHMYEAPVLQWKRHFRYIPRPEQFLS